METKQACINVDQVTKVSLRPVKFKKKLYWQKKVSVRLLFGYSWILQEEGWYTSEERRHSWYMLDLDEVSQFREDDQLFTKCHVIVERSSGTSQYFYFDDFKKARDYYNVIREQISNKLDLIDE